eukprot:TRINITY_DN108047_c0_g1_i1.p1 TRINITY_DN108047_c0_g1~~TRINITY_DN108047_c0_g1_i1.p1  ORF type:complete len:338 (-),score=69.82 TRINITY_DN108047_c0_g1_i1:15-1028(-)
MNQAKAMLDALMGPQRDAGRKAKKEPSDDWKDDSVCKNYLLGICPFDRDVLGGKRGLRICAKIHSELIRERFGAHADGAKGSEFRKEHEPALLRDCEEALSTCDKYSEKEIQKIRSTSRLSQIPEKVKEKVAERRREAADLERRADLLEKEANTTGGYHNLAYTWFKTAQQIREDADDLEKAEEKKLTESLKPEACDVCGTVYCNDSEYSAHLNWNVHIGCEEVRAKVAELQKHDSKGKKHGSRESASRSRSRQRSTTSTRKSKSGDRERSRAGKVDREKSRTGKAARASKSREVGRGRKNNRRDSRSREALGSRHARKDDEDGGRRARPDRDKGRR